MNAHSTFTRGSVACPMDPSNPNRPSDFRHWWSRAVALVGLPAGTTTRDLTVTGDGLSCLLKRLRALEAPQRCLLLAMACLTNPKSAHWLQREHGLHFGHLAASHLDTEVFQVLVGLLANHDGTLSN